MTTVGGDVPPEFREALTSIADARTRPEVSIHEVPAPSRLAPHSVALTGEVRGPSSSADDLATGRFVVLYDPAGQEAWQGRFRVVTLVRAALEPELADEEMLAQVAWTWFQDALHLAGASAIAAGGTVTRVLSRSFGALADRPDDVELEIRASWTPLMTDLGPHLAAWSALLCAVAGLPPLPDGVTPLHARRNTVGP